MNDHADLDKEIIDTFSKRNGVCTGILKSRDELSDSNYLNFKFAFTDCSNRIMVGFLYNSEHSFRVDVMYQDGKGYHFFRKGTIDISAKELFNIPMLNRFWDDLKMPEETINSIHFKMNDCIDEISKWMALFVKP